MAEKNNATCAICGKGYHMCISCRDEMQAKPWQAHTDTPEHYKVFQVVRGYNTGVYTKREAKAKLRMIDLSDLDGFRDNIRNIVEDIMGKTTKKELIVEDAPVVVVEPEPVINAEPDVVIEDEQILCE